LRREAQLLRRDVHEAAAADGERMARVTASRDGYGGRVQRVR
jgi:hypothetical protein